MKQDQRRERRLMALVEPTPDEKRNGWTAESLTRYLRDYNRGEKVAPDRRGEVCVETAEDHDPHAW